jgi:A/G-specific adenine glycosylase
MKRGERASLFVRGIGDWFPRHKRALPWRDLSEKDRDHRAYLVLVSEVMLQQTQVPRVVILYKNFIQKFPQMEDLSKASNADILTAWRGLGYNSRALRLRDAVRDILTHHAGRFPDTMEELTAIKGIGEYTASAVRNFAFGIPTPCLDTNIRRILHRFFVGPENPDGTWKRDDVFLLGLSGEIMIHALNAGFSCADWYAALMDFGSLVCTKNAPKWHLFNQDLKLSCMAYGRDIKRTKKLIKNEPGREMAGRFVPNRIFRGRIVDQLRDAKEGLTLDQIGRAIAIDWNKSDHEAWLLQLLSKLTRENIVSAHGAKFSLQA